MPGAAAGALAADILRLPVGLPPLTAALGALAALLPDVDELESTANRRLPVIGPALSCGLRQRTVCGAPCCTPRRRRRGWG